MMEKLLLLWINEKQLMGDMIMKTIICEKTLALYLLKQNLEHQWKRHQQTHLRTVAAGLIISRSRLVFKVWSGMEKQRVDTKATEGFMHEFFQLITAKEYIAVQL